MKRMPLLVLLLLATAGSEAQKTDGYSVTVHVTAAHSILVPDRVAPFKVQQLDATIAGKKFQLSATSNGSLLALGDYNAKLVQDDHKVPYESLQIYEFQFPDKKTVRFTVTGQSE